MQEAVDGIRSCALVVVASPTYKASYTGLLKSFLDWFSTTSLQGVTVVPVMTGAGAHHALAVEVHLRPVLVELGATLPTRGLYVTEARAARRRRGHRRLAGRRRPLVAAVGGCVVTRGRRRPTPAPSGASLRLA